MPRAKREDPRLARLTKLALALPEAKRQMSGRHAGFSVRAKTFAYYLDDHHGDGIVGICLKSASGKNAALIASVPTRYYLPAYLGPKGWAGLRLDTGTIDWDEVAELVTDSYRLIAPKSLCAQIGR